MGEAGVIPALTRNCKCLAAMRARARMPTLPAGLPVYPIGVSPNSGWPKWGPRGEGPAEVRFS